MGVVGGNFAKTFLNLNKRKFGAQSCLNPCPLAPARCQAAMAHVRRGATFLMQLISALSKRQGRAGQAEREETVSQQCVRTKFSSLATWSQAAGRGRGSSVDVLFFSPNLGMHKLVWQHVARTRWLALLPPSACLGLPHNACHTCIVPCPLPSDSDSASACPVDFDLP